MSEHEGTVYVGNLPWRTTEDDLAVLFEPFGPVVSARIIQDQITGRSCGYGFVELSSPARVAQACAELDGFQYNGRRLFVSPARPRRQRY